MLRRWIEAAAARLANTAMRRGLIHVDDVEITTMGCTIAYEVVLPGPPDDEADGRMSIGVPVNGHQFN